MLPLKPGCLALVTYGNSKGKTVTAVKHIGDPSKLLAHGNTDETDCWEVDPPVSWMFNIMMSKEIFLPYCPAKFLMRIDGFVEEDQTTTSDTVQLSTTT